MTDTRERALAGNALVKVFSNIEQYCMVDKFVALKDPTIMKDWEDIKIGSPKLGLPVAPK